MMRMGGNRSYLRDLLTQHLVDQRPLTRDQVEAIHEADIRNRHEFEERLPGRFWHESFPPFPEDWIEVDGGLR
jgi:hypothetical protein